MNFHNATFTAAFGTSAQLPPSSGPEVSFCGRSNVGKSSLLNKLMHRRNLAKVSAKPGKTATINFYDVDGADFVDLPGYGFAHVSKSEHARWSELIDGYFSQTRAFALVVVLIDIRHTKVSQLDVDMVKYVQEAQLPFVVALTKADKLSKQNASKNAAAIKRVLGLCGDDGAGQKAHSNNNCAGKDARASNDCVGQDAPLSNNCVGVLAISSQAGTNIEALRNIIVNAVDNPESL